MMKFLFYTIAICFCLNSAEGQTTYSAEINARIKQVENNLAGRIIIDGKPWNIIERMAHYNVKGLSMAVVHHYQVEWAKGYGWADEKEKRPVTTTTLFKPGSISKSLNAIGVLRLAQDGQLDLYTDINAYLTSWQFPYDSLSQGKKITPAQLLSHTAGLSVYGGFPGYERNSKLPTLPQVLDGVAPANTPPVRSLFEPGLQFQYSGGGTLIAQQIITDITHQGYEKFMYDSVLKPLGMPQSFYSAAPPTGSMLKKIATGYTKEGAVVRATFHVYPEQAPLGLWTTPTELGKFMTEMQLAAQGRSSKVLQQPMARLFLTPYIDNSATMGAFIGDREGAQYFFHDAGNEGYRGLYYGSVEGGNGVVVFVNSDEGNIILELLSSVAAVYNWKGFSKPASVTTKKIAASLAQNYTGVYRYDGKIAEVTKNPDGLYFWTDGQEAKMYFTSDTDFVNIEFSAEKSFIRDAAGRVTGYARKINGKTYPPATKVTRVDTLTAAEGQLNVYGWHLMETKRWDKAIEYITRAIALEPTDMAAEINLAHGYLFKKEYDKAIQLYKACLAHHPDDAAAVKASIKQDFAYFKKKGFDAALMKKAEGALKL